VCVWVIVSSSRTELA